MKRLVLIDGHAILYRAYHALPQTMTAGLIKPLKSFLHRDAPTTD